MDNSKKKLNEEQFCTKFFNQIREYYNVICTDGGTCQFSSPTNNDIHIDMSLRYIFEQYYYSDFNSYESFLADFINTIKNGMNMYLFKIDKNSIYPLVKQKTFDCKDIKFIRDDIENTELSILYVQDSKTLFKFISIDDLLKDNIDREELKQTAWNNLNKIIVPLRKIDDRLDVYGIMGFDNASSLVFSQHLQKQVESKLKCKDWIFSIPSSSTLFVAKYTQYNIDLIKRLQTVDLDYNKITNTIYRVKHGVLSEIKEKPIFTLVQKTDK